MPSASTKVPLELARGDAAMQIFSALVSC